MIYTGSYENCKSGRRVSISGDGGKSVSFTEETYKALAPKLDFWLLWHDNIGKISDIENNDFYITEYYKKVLQYIDPNQVLIDLENAIMLCYESFPIDEDYNPRLHFCHRHIVSVWLELECGILVPEITTDEYGNITELPKISTINDDVKRLIYKNINRREIRY